MGSWTDDLSRPLENAVYLELICRGYTVRVGAYRGKEVDFTAIIGNDVEYYPVTMSVLSEDVQTREFGALESIRGNFTKVVLTMDRFNLGTHNGIKVVNVIDWNSNHSLNSNSRVMRYTS